MARTKTNTKNNTKHEVDQDATDIQKTTIFLLFGYFYFSFLKCCLQKMLSYRLEQIKAEKNGNN